MDPELLYAELNKQVKDGAQEIIKAALNEPTRWWTIDSITRSVEGSYSRAALGLAIDRLLIDEVLETKVDAIAGRQVKLRR